MVKHYNPTIAEDANRIFNFKTGEVVSTEVAPFIQPIIPIQRKCTVIKELHHTTSGAQTLYTTPNDKDFYLTSVLMTIVKDATCDMASNVYNLTAVVDGVTISLGTIAILTLTAQSEVISRDFTIPIKIDRGSSIFLTANTFTAGTMSRSATICGYTVETTKGSS